MSKLNVVNAFDLNFGYALCNVFTHTCKAIDFKHASQQREIHRCMKEDEGIYMAVVENIRLMTLIHLLLSDETQAFKTQAWMTPSYWYLLNRKRNPSRKHSCPLSVNRRPIQDNRITCNLFNEYFSSILKSPSNDYHNLSPFQYLTDQRLLSPVIEPFEVFLVSNSLNPNICKGFDNVPNRIF